MSYFVMVSTKMTQFCQYVGTTWLGFDSRWPDSNCNVIWACQVNSWVEKSSSFTSSCLLHFSKCVPLISCVNIQHTEFSPKKIQIHTDYFCSHFCRHISDVSAPGLSPPRFTYWSRGSNHQPSQLIPRTPGQHCEDYVFDSSSASNTTSWEDDMTAGQSPRCVLDYWLPEWRTTWCAPAELCAIQGVQSYWSPTRDSSLPLTPHTARQAKFRGSLRTLP